MPRSQRIDPLGSFEIAVTIPNYAEFAKITESVALSTALWKLAATLSLKLEAQLPAHLAAQLALVKTSRTVSIFWIFPNWHNMSNFVKREFKKFTNTCGSTA